MRNSPEVTIALRFGFDVGVRRLRGALADDTIVAELSEPTRHGSAREIAGQLVGLAARLQSRAGVHVDGPAKVVAAGIAVPTPVDPRTGILAAARSLSGLDGCELGTLLERAFGFPVVVENDANAAALAEGWSGGAGAAIGLSAYVAVLIRTGIGMGIVLDGKLVRGWRGMVGEIDRMPLEGPSGSRLPARRRDQEFALIGSPGRSRVMRTSAGQRLAEPRSIVDAVASAAAGDAAASRAVRDQGRLVAQAITAAVALLDPELVTLGGEIGALPGLLEPIRAEVGHMIAEPPRIETSPLGERGPLLGALVAGADLVRSA
jgi:predicted NBD/HSP70 family sugar kinase